MGDFIINGKTVASLQIGGKEVIRIADGQTVLWEKVTPVAPTLVDYVHTSSNLSTENYINTGIYPTTDTVFRVVYKPNNPIGSTVVGFDATTTPIRCSSDNTDYRYFYHRGLDDVTFDFNSSRFYKTITFDSDGYADITVGNNYITDNLAQSTSTGTTQSTITPNIPIYLNVSSNLDFRSLEIWQNNVKVYDGHATVLNGTYGVYDSVGGTFTTQTYGGYSMSGGYLPADPNMLKFTAVQANSSVGYTSTLPTQPVLYCSTNGRYFDAWDGTAVTLSNIGDTLYVYGNNRRLANGSEYTKFVMTGQINAEGDVTYVLQNGGLTTLTTSYALESLFQNCHSLITPPSLPSTTLSPDCYCFMFADCVNMTTAPELPATTLADLCYRGMFQNCTSLTSAPELPASTLVMGCYFNMFYNCTSLNSVNCLATNISAGSCTSTWLYNVAATGTFTKSPNMSSWTTGASGIPTGWTVEDYYDCSDCGSNWEEC